MVNVERIGSVERHGEYFRVHVALNGTPLTPLWLSAPEFQAYEANGSQRMWESIAFKAAIADQQAKRLCADAIQELAQRRFS